MIQSSPIKAEFIQNVFSLLKAVSITILLGNTKAETQVSYSAVRFLKKSEITECCGLNVCYRAITQ